VGRAAATIIYTFVGGFLAVSWTDTVQASLMIFALILTPVIVIISVGGFGDSLEVIKQKSIENIDMLKGLNFVAIISLMGWGLGYFGQPHILARFMAADSHHSIVHARRISMTWMILCLAGRWRSASLVSPTSITTRAWRARLTRTPSACLSNWRKSCLTRGLPGSCCRRFWRR
jgi:sodium/proline symporter